MSPAIVPVPARGSRPRIKVLIVDDSALIRQLLIEIVNRQPDMVAVGAARDPYIAREMIRSLNPDVLTLDIEMPRMDGLDFLDKLMRLRPMPVVMVSSLTEASAETTLRGLELGAVDYVSKPKIDIAKGLNDSARQIVEKIRVAAGAHVHRRMRSVEGGAPVSTVDTPVTATATGAAVPVRKPRAVRRGTEKIIVIGASTGGTEAIKEVLADLPPDSPAVLVTQHMPPGFTHSFAKRLNECCRVRVKEAEDGERILPGYAYIAPGDQHLSIARSGANYVAALSSGPPVNRHRPAVEVLFRSAAEQVGANAIAVMLTGMGKDGARAMLELRHAGARTIAQDEKSCVVFGMPGEAIRLGAVETILPLRKICGEIVKIVSVEAVHHRV